MRPDLWIWETQTLLDNELQPKRRKSVAVELLASDDFPVLGHDPGTGHKLQLALEYPVHHQCRGRTFTLDRGRDDYVGIEDRQSHQALERRRAPRTLPISRSISSELMRSSPVASAWTQLSRRLAFAMALRSS